MSHLSDTIHTYVVLGCKLSGEIENILERCCEASAQVIEGLDGITNRWDSRWR